MARRHRPPASSATALPAVIVPADAPAWITPELITSTLETWQPYYEDPLTPDDACAMILAASELLGVLSRGTHRETVRRVGTGQQSRTGT
ncbi:MAG: hypothetical protein Q8K78_00735 [Planctomycetaceae bacterium]|nr:hypothetical protein [Planctomycetaceae bacterium]